MVQSSCEFKHQNYTALKVSVGKNSGRKECEDETSCSLSSHESPVLRGTTALPGHRLTTLTTAHPALCELVPRVPLSQCHSPEGKMLSWLWGAWWGDGELAVLGCSGAEHEGRSSSCPSRKGNTGDTGLSGERDEK